MSNFGLDIRIWDVEHGSAAFVRAGRKNAVIDCGANADFSPAKWIRGEYGINNLHYMIVSHPHHDHIEDLDQFKEYNLKPAIIQRPKKATPIIEEKLEEARKKNDEEYIEDAEYYLELDGFSGTPDPAPNDPKWVGLQRNSSRYRSDGGTDRGITFHNYSTKDPSLGNDDWETLNNLSKITLINAFGFKFVTTGDLLSDGVEEMLAHSAARSAVENADVLVAPHHGREESFVEDFVKHVNPDFVIFSDKGDIDNTATDDYRAIANGGEVYNEETDEIESPRYVLTTRNDGRIRIEANNSDDWQVSIYGTDYTEKKASSRRYNRIDKYR